MSEEAAAWGGLVAALAVFVLTHAIPARPQVRGRLVALMGQRVYLLLYSALSIVLLGWLIVAAANAPYVEVWPREAWQSLVPLIGMTVACVLAVFGLTSPNPLSLGGYRNTAFDPDHPGIAGVVRHPILWATLIWSASHMFPNGELSHVLVFGLFVLLSVGGMAVLDRRARRRLGEERWQSVARYTSNLPLLSLGRGWRPRAGISTLLRLALAVALYVGLILIHGYIAGVPLH